MSPPPISRQQVRLLVQQTANFVPPAGVAALGTTVDLDLVLGTQLLWTAAMKKTISYGALYDWIGLSVPNKSPHRFTGSSLGDDSEMGGDLSSTFAKVIGLAFMGEYASACWFTVLRSLCSVRALFRTGARRRPTLRSALQRPTSQST
jgi:hypothetical protein